MGNQDYHLTQLPISSNPATQHNDRLHVYQGGRSSEALLVYSRYYIAPQSLRLNTIYERRYYFISKGKFLVVRVWGSLVRYRRETLGAWLQLSAEWREYDWISGMYQLGTYYMFTVCFKLPPDKYCRA